MMETQDIDYVPIAVQSGSEVSRDRDNPAGYLVIGDREEPIYKEKTIIGRDLSSDIVIEDPQISRKHATIELKPKTIFICIHGKNNYIDGVGELEPERLYQLVNGAKLDFRSCKLIFKTNPKPLENGDEKETELNRLTDVQEEEEPNEDKVVNDSQEVAEEECTQFEDDGPAETSPGEKSTNKSNDESPAPSKNPFLDDSETTPDTADRPSVGFRMPRLPSFELLEQEISELETQPSEVTLKQPPEPKPPARLSGSEDRNKIDDSQMSTLGLRVSLEDSDVVLTGQVDEGDTQSQSPSTPKARKALMYEDDTNSIQIIDLEGNSNADSQEKGRAAELTAQEATQISPLVQRRGPRILSPAEVAEVQKESLLAQQASSTPSKKKVLDESTILEDSSDGIIEASDDEESVPKKLLVLDTQDRSAEDLQLEISTGVVADSQADESNSWEDSVENITAVEVVPKNPQIEDKTVAENNSEKEANSTEDSTQDEREPSPDEKFYDSICETPKKGPTPKRKRFSLSIRKSKKGRKPKESVAEMEDKVSPGEKEDKVSLGEKEDVAGNSKEKVLETETQPDVEDVKEQQNSKEVQVADKETVEVNQDVNKDEQLNKDEFHQKPQEEANMTETKANDEEKIETPNVSDKVLEKETEKPQLSKEEEENKVVQKSVGRKRKIVPQKETSEQSPDGPADLDISIAEEVKMSPRMAKVAAVEKIDSSVSPMKVLKKKAEPLIVKPEEPAPPSRGRRQSRRTLTMTKVSSDTEVSANVAKPVPKGAPQTSVLSAVSEKETKAKSNTLEEKKKRTRKVKEGPIETEKPKVQRKRGKQTDEETTKNPTSRQIRAAFEEVESAAEEPPKKSPKKSAKVEEEKPQTGGRAGRKQTVANRVFEAVVEEKSEAKPTPVQKVVPKKKGRETPTITTRSGRVSRRKRLSSDESDTPEVKPKEEPKAKASRRTKKVEEVIASPKVPEIKSQKKGRLSRKDPVEKPSRLRSSVSSSVSSSDSQSRTRTKHYVFFSGFEGTLKREKDLVTKLGGQCKDVFPDVKHKGEEFVLVVNGSFKRTLKVLDFIGSGSPIVSHKWLEACKKANSIVDAWDYILEDKEAEKKFGFNLRSCLRQASQTKVFNNWNLFFTPNVSPKGIWLKNCIHSLGGKFLPNKPKSWPNNLLVVSCDADKTIYQKAKKDTKGLQKAFVIDVQGFFECIQQQKIVPLDKFILE